VVCNIQFFNRLPKVDVFLMEVKVRSQFDVLGYRYFIETSYRFLSPLGVVSFKSITGFEVKV